METPHRHHTAPVLRVRDMAGQPPKRFPSVDILRGASVGFMIVANNPGDTASVYSALIHSRWHGWTTVDLIFPIFLFIVGVSVALSSRREAPTDGGGSPWPRALRRAAILFLLGLVVNGFPSFNLDTLRIPGVLQRIAVVYLGALWFDLHCGWRALSVAITGILAGYWLLWAFVPVPGLGFPTLDTEYNLEGWLDQMFMRGHLWEYDTSWDPEGILSTLPCVALALLGVLAGRVLRSGNAAGFPALLATGLALHCGGLAWDAWFPINKLITTSSFVLFSGGLGMALLAVCHRCFDGRPPAIWTRPFVTLGKNALFLYVFSELLTKSLHLVRVVPVAGGHGSLHFWLFEQFSRWFDDRYVASIAWGLLLCVFLCAMATIMERRGIAPRI